jgi:hypothetical protein
MLTIVWSTMFEEGRSWNVNIMQNDCNFMFAKVVLNCPFTITCIVE